MNRMMEESRRQSAIKDPEAYKVERHDLLRNAAASQEASERLGEK